MYFKSLTLIIILKLNKSSYDLPKSFQCIILLNTLGKLIEKVIRERMQFYIISNNFVYLYQFKGLKQWSISNIGIFLIYIIWFKWVKNVQTSILAFDIAQLFPSLNHHYLSLIFNKVGFHPKVLTFFSNYLIGRKT